MKMLCQEKCMVPSPSTAHCTAGRILSRRRELGPCLLEHLVDRVEPAAGAEGRLLRLILGRKNERHKTSDPDSGKPYNPSIGRFHFITEMPLLPLSHLYGVRKPKVSTETN
jgi:hypothetical protein